MIKAMMMHVAGECAFVRSQLSKSRVKRLLWHVQRDKSSTIANSLRSNSEIRLPSHYKRLPVERRHGQIDGSRRHNPEAQPPGYLRRYVVASGHCRSLHRVYERQRQHLLLRRHR